MSMLRSVRNYLTETTFPPSALIGLLVLVVLLAVFGASASKMNGSSEERARQIAEDAVRRAAVTCYAVEGCYPESYAYLCEHYNVRVDSDRFIVYYSVFASNIMPEIEVLPLNGGAA